MDIDMGIRNHKTGVILILFLALAAFAIWAPGADARSSYLTAFTTKYPDAASSKLNTCSLCHGSQCYMELYGQAIRIIGTNVSAA
jgi:cytochrome c553